LPLELANERAEAGIVVELAPAGTDRAALDMLVGDTESISTSLSYPPDGDVACPLGWPAAAADP